MPDLDYIFKQSSNKAPANAAGASAVYDPFAKLNEDNNKINSKVSDFLFSDTGVSNKVLNIDSSKYQPYSVYINDVDTEEQLNKERANNQSVWEQGGRMVGQTINEVGLGTVVGMADFMDFIVNQVQSAADKDHKNDYQSDITKILEDTKNSINERLEIYRENPNTAFDIGDFAWWASNAPSIASSLTLLIPSVGIAKGVSTLGKVTRFNKLANKVANGLKITQKSRAIVSKMSESVLTGSTSRLLENYQEARGTYQEVDKYVKDQFTNFTPQQEDKFFENNPEYKGKSIDEIAQNIAKNSADITFEQDWANVLFDIYQVYNLKNIWNNILKGSTTASTKAFNKQAVKMFGQDGKAITEALAKQTPLGTIKNTLKTVGEDFLHGVRTEWSEGVEEAVNYVASQNGMYNAQKVFDKNTPASTLERYLKDPMLWEQAFWGALGGIVFSTGGAKLGEFANRKLNKDFITAEEQKKNEILGRNISFSNYKERLNSIANNKNPFVTINNENPDIIAGQEEDLKNVAQKEYMDTMIINAMNAGNLDLLEGYIDDDNFVAGISNSLQIEQEDALALRSAFKNRIESTKDLYNNVMNIANSNGASFEVARIIASEYVENKNLLDSKQNIVEWSRDKLDQSLNADGVNIPIETETTVRNAIRKQLIKDIDTNITSIENDASIDKDIKQAKLYELNKKRNIIADDLITEDTEITNEDIDTSNKLNQSYPNIFNDIYNNVYAEIDRDYTISNIDLNNNIIKDKINELNNFFDKSRKKIVAKTTDDLFRLYRKYGSAEVNRVRTGNSNIISDQEKSEINNAFKVLNLSSPSNAMLTRKLQQMAKIADIERARNAENEENANPDKEIVNDDVEETNNDNNIINSEDEFLDIASPTGTAVEEETIVTEVPVEETNTETSPVSTVETPTSQPTPQLTPTQSINNIPDDPILRADLINDIINDLLYQYVDLDNLTIESVRNAKSAIANNLKEKGFDESEIDIEYNNIMGMLFPDVMYSRALDANVKRMLINAGKSILTQSNSNIEAILEDYAKSLDSEGRTRGRIINNKVYLSIGGLIEYLTSQTGNKVVHISLFNTIKEYLYNPNRNTRFRATDSRTISVMNNYEFTQYVNGLTATRYNFAQQKYSNNINISDLINNEEAYKTFITIKSNEKLDYFIDTNKNRILFKKNGFVLGYAGIPKFNSKDGAYEAVNQNWKYKIIIDKNGIIHSDFKDELIDILTNPFINNKDFIEKLYDTTFKYIIDPKSLEDTNEYNELYDLFYKHHKDFIDKYATSLENTNILMKHLIEITKFVFKNDGITSHEASLNRWFENLAKSYAQSHNLVINDLNGEVVVNNITYGVPNTESESNYEGNPINSTVNGYKESVNQLGVVINGQIQYSHSNKPIAFNNNDSITNGQIVMKMVSPDGYSHNVFCRQTNLNDESLSKNITNLREAAKEVIIINLHKYFSGEITFNELGDSIKQLIDNDGLFTGFGINFVQDRMISFQVKNELFDGSPFAITINAATGNYKSNVIIRSEEIKIPANLVNKKKEAYGIINNGSVDLNRIDVMLRPVLDKLFNNHGKIAVGKSHINDSTRKIDYKNRYIRKENGKTIIEVGNIKLEYKSYQDFLVKENAVKTKLRNDENTGNWKYTDSARLEIEYKVDTPNFNQNPVQEITSDLIIDRQLGDNIELFASAFKGQESVTSFESFFQTLPDYNLDNNASINYITELQDIGILPDNIEIVNSIKDGKGNEMNASYSRRNNKIQISKKAFKNLTIDRALRVIIHESIHQQLNNNFNRKDALEKVQPIYDKFKEWLNVQDDETKNKLNKFLFNELGNNIQANETRLEEFMVESITNIELMNILNSIKDINSDINTSENLFTKLIKAIAKIWNIIIDEDSLLATARDTYSNILSKNAKIPRKQKKKIKKNININEDKIDTTNTNPNDIPIINDNVNTTNRRNRSLDFSSISDNNVRNIESLTESLPLSVQANFDRLLSDGTISYHC